MDYVEDSVAAHTTWTAPTEFAGSTQQAQAIERLADWFTGHLRNIAFGSPVVNGHNAIGDEVRTQVLAALNMLLNVSVIGGSKQCKY